jgi:hypothetical protein
MTDLSESTEIERSSLTEQQQKFVQYSVQGISQTQAAELSGYSCPGQAGYALMQLPHIVQEIARQCVLQIETKLVPASLNCLYSIITNEKASPAARVSAASAALDRSRYITKQKEQPKSPSDKGVGELSVYELDSIITALRQRKSAEGAEDAQVIGQSSAIPE